MTAPPIVTVTYRPSGVAVVTATWDVHTVSATGSWSTRHAVWLPGRYDRSHRVGLHGRRLALVQQGITPLHAVDFARHHGQLSEATPTKPSRRGWNGWNIHDLRGDLAGCIGLSARDMLDVLGVCEMAREAGAEQHDDGGVLVTVIVEHEP